MDEQGQPAQEPGVYYVNGLGNHVQVDNGYLVVNGKRYYVTTVAELVTGMQHMAKQVTDLEARVNEERLAKTRRDNQVRDLMQHMAKQVTDLEARVNEERLAKTRRDNQVRDLIESMVDNDVLEKRDANEFLRELDIRLLETEYTAEVTLCVKVNIASEESADEVYDRLRGDVSYSVETDTYGFHGDYEVDDVDVISVDNVEEDE
jgi:vacuolar-type H+-ATPase subunit I/STV1